MQSSWASNTVPAPSPSTPASVTLSNLSSVDTNLQMPCRCEIVPVFPSNPKHDGLAGSLTHVTETTASEEDLYTTKEVLLTPLPAPPASGPGALFLQTSDNLIGDIYGTFAMEDPSLDALLTEAKGYLGVDAVQAISFDRAGCSDIDAVESILREALHGEPAVEVPFQAPEIDQGSGSMELDAHETGEVGDETDGDVVSRVVSDWEVVDALLSADCKAPGPALPMTPTRCAQRRQNPRAPASKSRSTKRSTQAPPTAAKSRLTSRGHGSCNNKRPFRTQDDIINAFSMEVLLLNRTDFNAYSKEHGIRKGLTESERVVLTATRRRLAGRERARQYRLKEREAKEAALLSDVLSNVDMSDDDSQ